MEIKKDIKSDENFVAPRFKSYSVDEILAAGGTTAFANKLGKNTEDLIKHYEELPDDSFWTEDEVKGALATLNANK